MKKSLPLLLVLICCSFLTAGMIVGALTTHDAIERLFSAGLGGIGAVVLAPYWMLFQSKRLERWAFLITGIVLLSMMNFNAWACRMSGTNQTHFYDQWLIAVFSLPAWGLLIWRYKTQKPIQTPPYPQ